MKKLVASAMIIGVLMVAPKCKGGQGEEHGQPRIANPVSEQPELSDPRKTDDRQRKVQFIVVWHPHREVVITWKVGSRGNSFEWYVSPWDRTVLASNGEVATLKVEQTGLGGFLTCSVYVDGKVIKPGPTDKFDPYMTRNDAGDCTASTIVR